MVKDGRKDKKVNPSHRRLGGRAVEVGLKKGGVGRMEVKWSRSGGRAVEAEQTSGAGRVEAGCLGWSKCI